MSSSWRPAAERFTNAWPRIVGAHLARVATPVRLSDDGVLEVLVASEEWAAELRELTERIVQRIGEVFSFPEWAGPRPIVGSIIWVVMTDHGPSRPVRETKVLAFCRRVR
jgi:hypothetical protein